VPNIWKYITHVLCIPVYIISIPALFYFKLKGLTLTTFDSPPNMGHFIQFPLLFYERVKDRDQFVFVINPKEPHNRFLLSKYSEKFRVYQSRFLSITINKLTPVLIWLGIFRDIREVAGAEPIKNFEYIQADNYVEFTDAEKEKGDALLKEMGIHGWYVCLYARDINYHTTRLGNEVAPLIPETYSWDIQTAKSAIEFITSRGGYVVRMGDWSCEPFSFHGDQYIDYPRTNVYERNHDFMDFYLSYKARFVVSSTGGYASIPLIFKTPILYVNLYAYIVLQHVKSMSICKILEDTKQGVIPLSHCIELGVDRGWGVPRSDLDGKGYLLRDNTAEEILNAVKEFMDWQNGGFEDSMTQLQENASSIFLQSDLIKSASEAVGVRPRFSNHFLNNHLGWVA
jgi:putative glycosyltransferase (TIGR04372 family)